MAAAQSSIHSEEGLDLVGVLEAGRLVPANVQGGEAGDAHAELLAVIFGTVDELKLNVGVLQRLLLLARPGAPVRAKDADLAAGTAGVAGVGGVGGGTAGVGGVLVVLPVQVLIVNVVKEFE